MKEIIREKISKDITENMDYIRELLKDNSDYVFREFYVNKWKAAIIYIDGMSDKIILNDYVMESLMQDGNEVETQEELIPKILALTDLKEIDKLSDGINATLAGEALLLIEGMEKAYILATRAWPARGVGEPTSETTLKGAKDGFTDTIRFNTALVRRRVRDTRYKVKAKQIGVRSKTDVTILYISDITDESIVKEVEEALDSITLDAILDSGYIAQYLEGDRFSPFPQVQSTERPDVVAGALYDGRVAILVDNSPYALIVPTTLPCLFQSTDDYTQKWIHSSVTRVLRFFSILLALTVPALYVAISSFHTSIIPTKLAYSIAASRAGVPFPAFTEALIMEISIALLIEAIIRLPKAIGSTIGIVGGLVVGQAAVSAGIVSPIMMIVLGLTSITTFLTPNYEVVCAFRLIRFGMVILATICGLYGIIIGLIILLAHLVKLESFGVPYLAPFVNTDISDFKDMIFRFNFKKFKERPKFLHTRDKIRQK